MNLYSLLTYIDFIILFLVSLLLLSLFFWFPFDKISNKITNILKNNLAFFLLIIFFIFYYLNPKISPQYLKLESFFHNTLSPPNLANPKKGQVWLSYDHKTRFSYNGQYWFPTLDKDKKYNTITPNGPVIVKMKLSFNKDRKVGTNEPLVTTGKDTACDFVSVNYLPDNKITFWFDHWGAGGPKSIPIDIKPNELYGLEIILGAFYPIDPNMWNSTGIINFNGKEVLRHHIDFYRTTKEEVIIGKDEIGGCCYTKSFSGKIVDLQKEFLRFSDK